MIFIAVAPDGTIVTVSEHEEIAVENAEAYEEDHDLPEGSVKIGGVGNDDD